LASIVDVRIKCKQSLVKKFQDLRRKQQFPSPAQQRKRKLHGKNGNGKNGDGEANNGDVITSSIV